MDGNWPGFAAKVRKFLRADREWVRLWPILADYFRFRRWRTAGKSLALLPAIFPCEAGLESLNPNSASRWPGMLYESCGCPERRLGALPASRSCFPGVLRLSPVSAPGLPCRSAFPQRSRSRGFSQPCRWHGWLRLDTLLTGNPVSRRWLVVFLRKLRNTGRQP